jgi:hypothetical protein
MIFALVVITSTMVNALDIKDNQIQQLKPSDEGSMNQEEDELELLEYSDSEDDYDFSEAQEVESDSSYYSVNKFNILFYFVYKLKYGVDEIPTED